MRRHPAFQDLSRDHFVALCQVVAVRRVVQGDRFAKPANEAVEGFLHLVREVLPAHFDEEEQILLPVLQSAGQGGHATRLRQEHEALRAGFATLSAQTPVDHVWRVAQALQAHVRWEEDVLFEAMQNTLGEDELADVLARGTRFRKEAGMQVGTRDACAT